MSLLELQYFFLKIGLAGIIGIISPEMKKKDGIIDFVYKNDIKRFVVIDDDFIFGLEDPFYKHFYKIKGNGLENSDIKNIKKIFNII